MTNAIHSPVESILSDGPAPAGHSQREHCAPGKLGTWIVLGTVLLMFGGLFCAYGAFRYNYPAAFAYGHLSIQRAMHDVEANSPHVLVYAQHTFGKVLERLTTFKLLGALSAVILMFGGFTMALGLRYAQTGKRLRLVASMLLAVLSALAFLELTSVQYRQLWLHHLGIGAGNRFDKAYQGPAIAEPKEPAAAEAGEDADVVRQGPAEAADPLADTPDDPRIKPSFMSPVGVVTAVVAPEPSVRRVSFKDMEGDDRARLSTFFSIFFLMTGLHGVLVAIGVLLIVATLLRAILRTPGPSLVRAVELSGLYWHMLILIWIFIFPSLYLIH